MMASKPDPTAAKRVTAANKRKTEAGMKQVRSLWSYPECFPEIRAGAAKITSKHHAKIKAAARKTAAELAAKERP
jgi:hypothetical protein